VTTVLSRRQAKGTVATSSLSRKPGFQEARRDTWVQTLIVAHSDSLLQHRERSVIMDAHDPIFLPIILNFDPLTMKLLIAAFAAAVGAIVKSLTERVLNRWVPEPRLAKPEPEYIL
jgi:hypothetical protein